MPWIKQRWVKEGRYYEASLQQDLWQDWVLTKVWGRRGSALGQIRDVPCRSYEEGLSRLEEVSRRRQQRRYVTVGSSGCV